MKDRERKTEKSKEIINKRESEKNKRRKEKMKKRERNTRIQTERKI